MMLLPRGRHVLFFDESAQFTCIDWQANKCKTNQANVYLVCILQINRSRINNQAPSKTPYYRFNCITKAFVQILSMNWNEIHDVVHIVWLQCHFKSQIWCDFVWSKPPHCTHNYVVFCSIIRFFPVFIIG